MNELAKNTIKCVDCNEPTWNRTERCGPCRKLWREKAFGEHKEERMKDKAIGFGAMVLVIAFMAGSVWLLAETMNKAKPGINAYAKYLVDTGRI